MKGKVMTVLGSISPEELGITLTHEHILIDCSPWFIEPEEASQKGYVEQPVTLDNLWWIRQNMFGNRDNLLLTDVNEAVDEVIEFKRHGGNSIVDVTNIGIGRDRVFLKSISSELGINVIMGSGYYIYRSHPPDMSEKTVEEIADEIVTDVTKGVGDTGIKAGIIGEIGIDDIEKYPNEEKSLRAAALAQKETGAPLTVHPPIERQCERIIEILEEEGADLNRVIMCHADMYLDESLEYTLMIADAGIYIGYDCFGLEGSWPIMDLFEPTDTQRVNAIKKLIDNGHLDKVLVSQDVCNKIQATAYGGIGRTHILKNCLPLFRQAGISGEEINAILVDNPKRVLQFV